MSDLRVEIGGELVEPVAGWIVTWLDPATGIMRLSDGAATAFTCVVEGAGTEWHVVLRGRRVPVAVRTRREELLTQAALAAGRVHGPVEVRASLPGLVVAIETADGAEVAEGDPLLTIEAMKMQNEVRAARAGRVVGIAVAVGQTVGTGDLLLRLE